MLPINDTLNKSRNNPLGKGNHQTRIKAGIVKRIPISKYGGKYSMAGLAMTKPKPKRMGTDMAIRISRKLKYSRLLYRNSFFRIEER